MRMARHKTGKSTLSFDNLERQLVYLNRINRSVYGKHYHLNYISEVLHRWAFSF